MPLPEIKIIRSSGQLRRTAPVHERVALVYNADTVAYKFTLETSYTIYSPDEAREQLGFASDRNGDLLAQISDFYRLAPFGTPLVVFGLKRTRKLDDIYAEDGPLNTLLKQQNGQISLLCLSHIQLYLGQPKAVFKGLPGGINSLGSFSQLLAAKYKTQSQPFHVLVAAHNASKLADLVDYSVASYSNVSFIVSSISEDKRTAALGFTAGYIASLPVQRKLSRVKNGSLPIRDAYFTTGERAEDKPELYTTLDAKRFLFIRTYQGREGYYFANDNALAAPSHDFASIAANRVINKATRLSYQVFIHEISEEVSVDEDGTLSNEAARYYEGLIEDTIGQQMVANGELNGVEAYVDDNQQVLKQDKLQITLHLQPVGYTSSIEVRIGFSLSAAA